MTTTAGALGMAAVRSTSLPGNAEDTFMPDIAETELPPDLQDVIQSELETAVAVTRVTDASTIAWMRGNIVLEVKENYRPYALAKARAARRNQRSVGPTEESEVSERW